MTHPIVACASDITGLLKGVAGVNPTFMSTEDKAAALRGLARVEAQVAELRLRVLADADDLAGEMAAKDAAGWLTHETRVRFDHARADLKLAEALDCRYPVVGAALRSGEANVAQARVIVRALDALPDTVDADTVAAAEAHLVGEAAEFGPRELGRLGRHVLQVVAPEIAEEAEAKALAELEANAAALARLTVRRVGDGTIRGSFRLPDLHGDQLVTYLEPFANPRKEPDSLTNPENNSDPLKRLPKPRRMGLAFCQFLESIDPQRLPIHGGDATTLIVTMPLDSLRAELATAEVLSGGMVPGDELAGGQITASQARRLACTGKIIPAVLGGDSIPLDLGRARRLFSPGQRKALLIRDKTCRAEGCDIPGVWCEAHHLDPWTAGGKTNLTNGLLLCSHHHHRIHDNAYRNEKLANGDLRFHRRR